MFNGLPRILIIRLSAIGDVVRVVPALHSLRQTFPDAQIDWVVEPKSAEVIEGHADLDRVLVFERSADRWESIRNFMSLCRAVRKSRYDIVVDFHGILKSGLIAGCSRAPQRYGFARPRSQEGSYWFTNRKVVLGPEVVNRLHENFALCAEFNAGPKSLNVEFYIPDEVVDEVDTFYHETFHGAKWVVAMHVAVDRSEKQWPLGHFAELADLLLSDGRFEVLLTYGPGQAALAAEVVRRSQRKPTVAPELPTLKHYMALADLADLYFGGDTGPMHIASALGTPVVAVFGGTSPKQHEPLRGPYEVLSVPEVLEANPQDLIARGEEYLSRLSPEDAYDACVRICGRGEE